MTASCVQLPARDRDGPEADVEITRSLQDQDVLKFRLLIRWEAWGGRRWEVGRWGGVGRRGSRRETSGETEV